MLKEGLSRRQFVGGAAAAVGAAAIPSFVNVSEAAADAGWLFPISAAQTEPWTPLDPTAAARHAMEIYRSQHAGQGG